MFEIVLIVRAHSSLQQGNRKFDDVREEFNSDVITTQRATAHVFLLCEVRFFSYDYL